MLYFQQPLRSKQLTLALFDRNGLLHCLYPKPMDADWLESLQAAQLDRLCSLRLGAYFDIASNRQRLGLADGLSSRSRYS